MGRVILAGAGPGDAELDYVETATQASAEADVIITDRLVNPEIIETMHQRMHWSFMAGKQGYNDSFLYTGRY